MDPNANPASVSRTARTDDATDVVMAVVEAIADVKGVSATDLRARLHDVVDPEALALFVRSADDGATPIPRVGFTMARCSVVVRGDGRVVATPMGEEPTGEPGATGSPSTT